MLGTNFFIFLFSVLLCLVIIRGTGKEFKGLNKSPGKFMYTDQYYALNL